MQCLWAVLKSDTLMSAISAIFTAIASGAIIFAIRQLRFDAWLKAQEIFTDEKFTQARGKVFARLKHITTIGLTKIRRKPRMFVAKWMSLRI